MPQEMLSPIFLKKTSSNPGLARHFTPHCFYSVIETSHRKNYISMQTLLNGGGIVVATVKVSSKYQIVIPQDVRERIELKPGQDVVIIEKDGVIHVIPLKPMKEMRGFLKGMETGQLRDEEDRF
jgi:AbrB family looped-hinge helix DNA binding protein